MNRETKIPMSTGSTGGYVGEGGLIPTSEPTFPGGQECRCIAPRIYSQGHVADVCERCGLPPKKGRRQKH